MEAIEKSEKELIKLRENVKAQTKVFKKLQEDDKINDQARSEGNEEVEADMKLKEETEN